jgi:hypothetical protein
MRSLPLLLAAALLVACGGTPAPDLILAGGRIFTADSAQPWAEAIAIAGDRIQAVGSDGQVRALAGRDTRVVELGGRVVVPGFNDAHDHLDDIAPGIVFAASGGPMPDPSLAAIRDSLQVLTRRYPPGTWLQTWVGERILSDPSARRVTLDRMAQEHPVILWAWSGHGLVLNSAALTALGIPDSIRDPMGGRFDRDPAGRLTGLVEEYANYAVVTPAIGRLLADSTMVRVVRDRAAAASALGVTSIQTFLLSMEPERAARVLSAANLPARVRLIRAPRTGPDGRLGGWEGVTIGPRDTVSGTKYILDGTPVERLAATRADYIDRPGWHGRLNFPADTLRAILQEALASGDQPLLHAVGDSAIALILSTMESLAPDTAWRRVRVRIEHGDGTTPDLIPHAARMGVMIVQNPTHFALGGMVPARFGPERAAVYQPLRSLLAAGVPLALGGDGPNHPFVNLMFCLVHPDAPDEAITMEQAVIAYTRSAAWAEGREQEKGTLTVGKLADLAVLSQDIFAARPEQLPATTSLLTLLGGRPVHDAGVLSGLR